MPRVNLNRCTQDEDIRATIAAYRARSRMSVGDLVIRSGVNANTYYAGMKDPSAFRLRDLRALYDTLRVPSEERKGF